MAEGVDKAVSSAVVGVAGNVVWSVIKEGVGAAIWEAVGIAIAETVWEDGDRLFRKIRGAQNGQ